jgi:hypothetical protein
VTNDPHSADPMPPRQAAPDDPTSAYPTTGIASATGAGAGTPQTPSPWAAPAGPSGAPSGPSGAPSATPVAVEAPPARRRGGSGMLVNVLLGIALVVAVGGVAFAAGRVTAPATVATGRGGLGGGAFGPTASGGPGGFGNGGFGGGGFGGGGFGGGGASIQGTVTAISAGSITVQLAGGQTVTIPLDAQTTYHERTAATAAAVTSGSTVVVQLSGGRGANGNGNGNGNGGQGGGPNASGAPGRALGPATTVTVVPAGS